MPGGPTRRSFLATIGGAAVLAGCLDGVVGSDTDPDPDPEPDPDPDPASDSQRSGTTGHGGADTLEWDEATLEDVTTGESFSIAALEAPVVVHTFASYCPTCQRQEADLGEVWGALAGDGVDASFVSLAITGGDEPADVVAHAEENDYEWRFAVADESLANALVEEFGYDISVHAESPLVVRRSDGSTETLEKVAPAAEIRAAVDG